MHASHTAAGERGERPPAPDAAGEVEDAPVAEGTAPVAEGATSSGRALRLTLFLALATPLVFAKGLLFPFVIPKAFYIQALVALALVLSAVEWLRAGTDPLALRRLRPRRSPVLWALAAFVMVAALSGALGEAPERSLLGTLERRWGVLTWAAFLGFYFLLRAHLDHRGWHRALQVAVAVGAATSAYGLASAAGVLPRVSPLVGGTRISATLGNPGYLAATLVLTLGLTGYLAWRASGWKARLVYGAAAAVQLAAVVLSGTRAVVLGAGAAALLVGAVWVARGSDQRHRRVAVGGAAAALVAVAAAVLVGLDAGWAERIADLSWTSSSARARFMLWGALAEGVKEAPLLGVGPENLDLVWSRHFDPVVYHLEEATSYDRAHNVFVGAAVTTGLVGLTAYLSMWGAAAWCLLRAFRRGALAGVEAALLGSGLLVYLVYLGFWFEDHSSFLFFLVTTGFLVHLASGGGEETAPAAGSRGARGETTGGGPPPGDGGLARRLGAALALVALAAAAGWHNPRVLSAARHTWDGEYSLDAWEGAERFAAALGPALPGSRPVLDAYLRRLTFLARHGDEGEAEGWTARMARAYGTAEEAVRAWEEGDPRNPHVYVVRSRLCGLLGKIRGGGAGEACVERSLRRAIELSPRQIRFRHFLAAHHLATGEPGEAEDVLRRALQVYASFGETYYYLARTAWEADDREEALRQARIALSLNYGEQPSPFVLEVTEWLEAEGRHGEAARLVRDHLALRYRGLRARGRGATRGRGFRPWDDLLASRLPVLHLRAGAPDQAVSAAGFLAARLPAGEDSRPSVERVEAFVRDVEDGRLEEWKGRSGVLRRGEEARRGGGGNGAGGR